MSKRARITLDLDPEPSEAEPAVAAAKKRASKAAVTPGSGTDEIAPSVRETRAKSKSQAKPRASSKAAARSKTAESRKAETAFGDQLQAARAGNQETVSDLRQTGDAARRPNVSAAPSVQAGSEFQKGPAKAAQPSAPPPDMFNLGTALKVGVVAVGLVVVSVVWWLKRKP